MGRQWYRFAFGRLDTMAERPAITAALDAFTRGGNKVTELMVGIATTTNFRSRRPIEQ
jgi:hypothetical protein